MIKWLNNILSKYVNIERVVRQKLFKKGTRWEEEVFLPEKRRGWKEVHHEYELEVIKKERHSSKWTGLK